MKKQHPENGIGSDMSKLPLIRSLADIGKTHSSAKSKDRILSSNDFSKLYSFDDEAIQSLEHIFGALPSFILLNTTVLIWN